MMRAARRACTCTLSGSLFSRLGATVRQALHHAHRTLPAQVGPAAQGGVQRGGRGGRRGRGAARPGNPGQQVSLASAGAVHRAGAALQPAAARAAGATVAAWPVAAFFHFLAQTAVCPVVCLCRAIHCLGWAGLLTGCVAAAAGMACVCTSASACLLMLIPGARLQVHPNARKKKAAPKPGSEEEADLQREQSEAQQRQAYQEGACWPAWLEGGAKCCRRCPGHHCACAPCCQCWPPIVMLSSVFFISFAVRFQLSADLGGDAALIGSEAAAEKQAGKRKRGKDAAAEGKLWWGARRLGVCVLTLRVDGGSLCTHV